MTGRQGDGCEINKENCNCILVAVSPEGQNVPLLLNILEAVGGFFLYQELRCQGTFPIAT